MSYGAVRDAACPHCGYLLSVIDYTVSPPPIPMRVPAGVTRRDDFEGWLSECPDCGEELDGERLLGRDPIPLPRRPVKSAEQADIARELREIQARFESPDPFVRYAAAREFKG